MLNIPLRYFLSLLSLMYFSSIAQNYNEPKAKEIIQKSVAKSKSFKSYKVEFKYTLENRMDTTKTIQTGSIYLKEGKFRLSMGDQMIISDTKTVWIYLKKANEVQINTYNPEDLEINPNDIFTMWEKGFLCGFVGEFNLNGKVVELVELTPHDKSSDYFKVKLYIDKTTKLIVRMQTYYKNSNIVTFDIKTFTPNIALADAFFKFDATKYPGVQVIDLRE